MQELIEYFEIAQKGKQIGYQLLPYTYVSYGAWEFNNHVTLHIDKVRYRIASEFNPFFFDKKFVKIYVEGVEVYDNSWSNDAPKSIKEMIKNQLVGIREFNDQARRNGFYEKYDSFNKRQKESAKESEELRRRTVLEKYR